MGGTWRMTDGRAAPPAPRGARVAGGTAAVPARGPQRARGPAGHVSRPRVAREALSATGIARPQAGQSCRAAQGHVGGKPATAAARLCALKSQGPAGQSGACRGCWGGSTVSHGTPGLWGTQRSLSRRMRHLVFWKDKIRGDRQNGLKRYKIKNS